MKLERECAVGDEGLRSASSAWSSENVALSHKHPMSEHSIFRGVAASGNPRPVPHFRRGESSG